ncbi:unnamed protein product [Meganyctiphanes norvegica]|uniref:Uncharacterized protein n=1 Tax=Meganyctiphanes norvegica TaxID=48144 RepID=A0AAV2Q827_MEGNR
MDYSTKVLSAKSVLTLLLVVGAVSCTPLPDDPTPWPSSPPSTHLEPPVHSIEVSHEVRHVSVEVNEHAHDPSIISVQDAADSTPEPEPPLPSDNPTSPYNIRHLGFTPTGNIDTLQPVYTHPTPPKIIEAKDIVQDKKQDEEVAAAASTSEPTVFNAGTISSHNAEGDNDFPQPEGEPEEEYIGLETEEPLKDIADQISVISQPLQDYVDQAKDEAQKIQDEISKNIEETMEAINEASEHIFTDEATFDNEHINNAADSIKTVVEYVKTASEPIVSGEENILSETKSETDNSENINEDFEIVEDKDEPIESDYELIDDAVEFFKDGAESFNAEANKGFDNIMAAALKMDPEFNSNINLYEDFGETHKADIENKDENLSDHPLEAASFGNEIPKDESHIEIMATEDTTETPVSFEDHPQTDQPALVVDQEQKHELKEENVKSPPKGIVEEDDLTEELQHDHQPLETKDQEEKEVFIDAVKRSDTGTENLEFPQEDEPVGDATPSESPRESRVYIEEIHGTPEEQPVDFEDAPKDIVPEVPVEGVSEMNEEDSNPESATTSPIPDVHPEEDYTHLEDFSEVDPEHKEPLDDAKMATDSPIESIKKELEISHDIPIDVTQNEEVSKDKEPIPNVENDSALNNNGNEEEIPEENIEDVQSSGDEHVDEEVPDASEDDMVNEAEQPLDEATEAPPVVPSVSEESPDDHIDPVAGAPLPDQGITHHEPTEHKRPKPKSNAHPKAEHNDQVHPHKLSASDREASAPRYLPPRQEQVSVAAPESLTAGSIVGIVFGVLLSISVLVGAIGFMMYQRRGHNGPKPLQYNRDYAGSDSGGYIDDDAVRVSYVNSQVEMPKKQYLRQRSSDFASSSP